MCALRTSHEGEDDVVSRIIHIGGDRPSIGERWRGAAGVVRSLAAVVIVHEALHHAGMSEFPFDEEALTSSEIAHLVWAR